jgi:hypothetical protein
MHAMCLPELIGRHLQVKERGWTDAQMVSSLIMLNLAGGDCMEDLSKVEKDEGFFRILRRVGSGGSGGSRIVVGAKSKSGVFPRRVQHFGIYRHFMMVSKRRSELMGRRLFLFQMSICGDW